MGGGGRGCGGWHLERHIPRGCQPVEVLLGLQWACLEHAAGYGAEEEERRHTRNQGRPCIVRAQRTVTEWVPVASLSRVWMSKPVPQGTQLSSHGKLKTVALPPPKWPIEPSAVGRTCHLVVALWYPNGLQRMPVGLDPSFHGEKPWASPTGNEPLFSHSPSKRRTQI